MELFIKGKQIDIGDALRIHIEDKLPDAVEKYFDNITDSHVTITKENQTFKVDIQVHVSRRISVHGQGSNNDAYSAFDEACENVAKRLRRYKRRLKDHKGRQVEAFIPANQYILQSEPDHHAEPDHHEEEDQPIIIAELQTEIETLDVGDAVMRMDLANMSALMFRSSKHGGLNMVYIRDDGNIGWVDPRYAQETKISEVKV